MLDTHKKLSIKETKLKKHTSISIILKEFDICIIFKVDIS